jgi:predicted nucleic acid-binding protein
MRYLVDTNILLRLADTEDSRHTLVTQAIEVLLKRGDEILIAPQCFYELWSVVTRPKNVNGLEWTLNRTRLEVDRLCDSFAVLPETPSVFAIWLELVTTYKVSGKQVHDARLAATAKAHEIKNLLTLNVDDFKRFDLEAIHPSEVLQEE